MKDDSTDDALLYVEFYVKKSCMIRKYKIKVNKLWEIFGNHIGNQKDNPRTFPGTWMGRSYLWCWTRQCSIFQAVR